jgi:molybdate transport system permease protein
MNRGRRDSILILASLPLGLFLTLPLIGLIFHCSINDILSGLFEESVVQAMRLSVVTTLITIIITVAGGLPLAYLLARRRFFGRGFVDALIDLPIVLPPSVAGIALLVAFGRRGFLGPLLGSLHLDIAFTEVAVVLAQLFVASPLFIKSATAGFASVNRDLEQAAAIDGASRFQVFRRVTLPLCSHALLGGAVMTWARALGEFGATIIFAGNFPGRTQTMPLAIYIGFEIDLQSALTLAVILLLASFAILYIVKRVLRKQPYPG